MTYGEAARMTGRAAQGLGPLLNAIRAEEAGRRRPDLGALIVKMTTGLPSYVGAWQDARDRAIAVQEAVFAARATRS